MKVYTIQIFSDEHGWDEVFPFTSMQKSYANGAFAMLKAFYNKNHEYRMIDNDGNVVETCGKGIIKTS